MKTLSLVILLLFLVLSSCDQGTYTEKADPAVSAEQGVLQTQAPAPQELGLWEKINARGLISKLNQSYSLVICYAFYDTPDRKRLSYYFTENLREICRVRYPAMLTCKFLEDPEKTQRVLFAADSRGVGAEFFKSVAGNEIGIAAGIYTAEQILKLRCVHLLTGRMGPVLEIPFRYCSDAATITGKNLTKILGWEGFFVESKGADVTFVLRGRTTNSNPSRFIHPGNTFCILRGKRLVAGVYAQVEQISLQGSYLVAHAKALNRFRFDGSEKFVLVYFTGGSQTIRLIDSNGRPQEGFSIFSSYEKFDDSKICYRGTTDISGKFTLVDPEKKPIYLLVSKSIEGENFYFVRTCIVVQNSGVQEFIVQTLDEIKANQPNSESNYKELRRQISLRLDQAREDILKKELSRAELALKYARKQLNQLPVNQRAAVRPALAKIEAMYIQVQDNKQMGEDRLKAFDWIQKADKEVEDLNYHKAQILLEKAEPIWPKAKDPEGYEEIIVRLEGVKNLINQEGKPLGMARRYLAEKPFSFNSENISPAETTELEKQVLILLQEGELWDKKIYNDRNRLLKLRTFLDKLSEDLSKKAQFYSNQYKQAEKLELKQREQIHKQHKHYYEISITN